MDDHRRGSLRLSELPRIRPGRQHRAVIRQCKGKQSSVTLLMAGKERRGVHRRGTSVRGEAVAFGEQFDSRQQRCRCLSQARPEELSPDIWHLLHEQTTCVVVVAGR